MIYIKAFDNIYMMKKANFLDMLTDVAAGKTIEFTDYGKRLFDLDWDFDYIELNQKFANEQLAADSGQATASTIDDISAPGPAVAADEKPGD